MLAPRRLVGALSCSAVVLVLSSCSLFVPKLQTPRLSVVGVELQKGALWQQKLKVRMHVDNPNDREHGRTQ